MSKSEPREEKESYFLEVRKSEVVKFFDVSHTDGGGDMPKIRETVREWWPPSTCKSRKIATKKPSIAHSTSVCISSPSSLSRKSIPLPTPPSSPGPSPPLSPLPPSEAITPSLE
jgi:hypothetical protein